MNPNPIPTVPKETPQEKISWETLEYEFKEKSSDWLWIFGILCFVIATVSVIFGNFLFAVLIIVGAFAMLLYAYRRPQLVTFELNEVGVVIGKMLYPYASLESFWVEQNEKPPKLLVKSKKTLMPLFSIPLGNTKPELVRSHLEKFMQESELREPAVQKILEHFGF